MAADPRWSTPRTPGRPTLGPAIAGVSDVLGTPFMPWQRMVAEVGGELVVDEETGVLVPAYPEVNVTVPRQNGKTTLVLGWIGHRLVVWDAYDHRPQQAVYTAQSGSDARKKFRDDMRPTIERSAFSGLVSKWRATDADTGANFANGANLSVWSNSLGSGHGATIDFGVLDEIFDDEDDRREQAMVPAMATRHDRQKLVTSTAGTDRSVLFHRKQKLGRQAVEAGVTSGIAYFEWSAREDEDPEDPETWRRCMPALGFTITERTVRQALEEMRREDGDLTEFRRAWLNIPSRQFAQVIPPEKWAAVCQPNVAPEGRLVLGVDGDPDLRWASLVVADEVGRVELVERAPAVGWVEERVAEVVAKTPMPVVLDGRGPVAFLADGLEGRGVQVVRTSTSDYVHACSQVMTKIVEGQVRVRSHPGFDSAVAAARKRPIGDSWVWARRSIDADISPLVAMTLAVLMASVAPPEPEPARKPLMAFG